MQLPEQLVTAIREGKAILFLGAGASHSAVDRLGNTPPTGRELAKLLSTRFLGGQYATAPLTLVADYAISESDLGTVQAYIRDLLEEFQPTPAHIRATQFRWHGIATTNYDRLIEKAYACAKTPLQSPRALIEETDKVEDNQRDSSNVLLLKLHGCVSRIASKACPLILTPDQYADYRQARGRLFDILTTWAYEHPIVFIGYSLQDPDIRAMLKDLVRTEDFRPRNYIISPDVDEISSRYWANKKVTALKGTFEEFTLSLDTLIAPQFRSLSLLANTPAHPIQAKFKVRDITLSRACTQFLEVDVDYVNGLACTSGLEAQKFYRGVNEGFGAIEQSLDVHRALEDTLISDYVFRDAGQQSDGPELVLIKAHAGAGKTVLLRRLAWDAAREYDQIVLYLRDNGMLSAAAVEEIIQNCKARVFLFIDDASSREREIRYLFRNIGVSGRFLTIIAAERLNEWNMVDAGAAALVTDEYELKYLNSKEIDELLSLLEHHRALGTLAKLGPTERKNALAERAGRQLLVALHEATLGYSFEEILVDEYKNISTFEARDIYLTVCVLNRLGVPVRAGLIARIHNVPFEKFKERLFAPLEHVVFAEYYSLIRDFTYRARHPHIADIVFMRVLSNPEERYDRYLKVLRSLNLSYSVDKSAFWQMLRGRTILELFPNHELARSLFDAAGVMLGEDPHLFHQRGIYEMNRPNGSLVEAQRLLARAAQLSPLDDTIRHSMAELKLRTVDTGRTALEREALLREATELSLALIASEPADSYAHHTLLKAALKRFRFALESSASDQEVERHIKDFEISLYDGLQRFPGDPFLLEAEAEFASLLSDNDRVTRCLTNAFAANPRSGFVALRLAALHRKAHRDDEAKKVLERALEANRNDRRLHFAYAKLLVMLGETDGALLEYHLRRSFTEGDDNYEAQLLFGRQLYINGDLDGSRNVFRNLTRARLPHSYRVRQLYPLHEFYEGRIVAREGTYALAARDGFGDRVYVHSKSVSTADWKNLAMGTRIRFRIAFTMKGTSAFDVSLTDSGNTSADQMNLSFKAVVSGCDQ